MNTRATQSSLNLSHVQWLFGNMLWLANTGGCRGGGWGKGFQATMETTKLHHCPQHYTALYASTHDMHLQPGGTLGRVCNTGTHDMSCSCIRFRSSCYNRAYNFLHASAHSSSQNISNYGVLQDLCTGHVIYWNGERFSSLTTSLGKKLIMPIFWLENL